MLDPTRIVLCKDKGSSCCPTLEDCGDGTHLIRDDDGGMVILTDAHLNMLAEILAPRLPAGK